MTKSDRINSIIPGVPLQPVPNTQVLPYSALGLLRLTFATGEYMGTGALIAPNRVLTAAHNLIGSDLGAVQDVAFVSAWDNRSYSWNGKRMPEEYELNPPPDPIRDRLDLVASDTAYLYDFAVIRLRHNVPAHTLPMRAFSARELECAPALIAGFTSLNGAATAMYECQGNLMCDPNEELLSYSNISTNYGQSGSPILANVEGEVFIVGVHVAGIQGINTNFGVWLNDDRIAEIENWIA